MMLSKIKKNFYVNRIAVSSLLWIFIILMCAFVSGCSKEENAGDIEEINQMDENKTDVQNDNTDENFFVPVQTYNDVTDEKTESFEYGALYMFLKNKMMDGYSVHTQYLPTNAIKDYATGYDVLSESQGLFMDFALNEQDEDAFRGAFSFVENNMLTEQGIGFRYAKDGSLDKVNAAVDDLRIIGALLRSEDVFGDKYYDIAVEYGKSFLETNVDKGYVVDYYSQKYKCKADFITLCYADFNTLSRLSDADEQYKEIYNNMLSVVEGGYIGDDLPFYQTRYNYKKKEYETDRINMVECVLTMIHLAEAGRLETRSVEYIKALVDEGVVYSLYDIDGTYKTDEQSTAVYGLIALLAKAIGDKQLYDSSIALMQNFQVMDQTSEVYGGYADADSLMAFSFDNLIALLAYSEGYIYD